MKHKFLMLMVLGLLLFGIGIVQSQSNAIMEIVDVEGTLVVNWVVTPTARVVTTTPSASQTPWIITATPSDVPTQEVFTPTFTNTPENSPTPTPDACYGTVVVDGLRIRDSYPSGTTIGNWAVGTRVEINQLVPVDISSTRTDEWAEVLGVDRNGNFKLGWSAVFYNFVDYIEVDPTQVCLDLEFPAPQASLLWHTVPGFNIGNARVANQILETKNIDYGYKSFAGLTSCIEVLENGGTCIYRHGNPDCPQNIGSANPRQSARDFLLNNSMISVLLTKYPKAYYEPVNECLYGDVNHPEIYVWWAEWMDEFILEADRQGLPKLVLPTLGPGHGDEIMFRTWKAVLEKNDARGGLLGEHAYTPFNDNGLCGCDEWLACRHRTNEQTRQNIGLNIQVAITEAARGWGNDPVDVDDFVCWYEEIKNDPFLHSVSLWLAGYHLTWPLANLDNFMVLIADNLTASKN